jgi:hypothetical protein
MLSAAVGAFEWPTYSCRTRPRTGGGSSRSSALQNVQRLEKLYGDAASYQYGEIHAQLGNRDEALSNLEHGWQIRDAGLLPLKVDPCLDPIRAEPRFAPLLGKMNFPD